MHYIIITCITTLLFTAQYHLSAMFNSPKGRQLVWCRELQKQNPQLNLLLYLAQQGVDVNQPGQCTFLHTNTYDRNKGITYDRYALVVAAEEQRWDIVLALIFLGANPNVKDFDRLTPLHYAAQHNQTTIAYALISAGADVNAMATNKDWQTPMRHALYGKNIPLVTFMLAHGYNKQDIKDSVGISDTMYANYCNIDLEALREKGIKQSHLHSTNS